MRKKKYLASFLFGALYGIFGAAAYGQCTAEVRPNDKSAIMNLRQSQVDQTEGFGNTAFQEYYFICANNTTLTLNPGGLMQTLVNDWMRLMDAVGASVGVAPGVQWWTSTPPNILYQSALYDGSGNRVGFQSVSIFGRGSPSYENQKQTYVTKRNDERVRVTTRITGGVWSSVPVSFSFTTGERALQAGLGAAGVKLYPRWESVPDPCATAFKVNFTPDKINLGSQTTQNFRERSVPMRVEARKDPNRGCWALSAEPYISFNVVNGGTEFGGNVIRMDNGSEILIEDTSGKPVVFGQKEGMGSSIGGGSESHKVQRVTKEYRLTWRKTPGENLVEDQFKVTLKAFVEFR